MATASGTTAGKRRSVMPFVAYAVVLALLVLAGVAVWTGGRGGLPGLPRSERASLQVPPATSIEAARTARALKLPPRPAAPVKEEPAPSPPPQADAAEKKSDPAKAECKVDFGHWPTDRTDQAQAIQVLLRHLGYYRGTTNGTVGPQTRTAIREFQLASGEAETGEVNEALFEQLKKKCAASAP
ncbi:MAG: peptidoglycan-binding protein [Rhodospirillales bacterium]|nr:peptidoglycan-binding protein [Rhodospirillales bacterium]